jgi:hypothetical protein
MTVRTPLTMTALASLLVLATSNGHEESGAPLRDKTGGGPAGVVGPASAATAGVTVATDGAATGGAATRGAKTAAAMRICRAGARLAQHGGQTVVLFRTALVSERFEVLSSILRASYKARVEAA